MASSNELRGSVHQYELQNSQNVGEHRTTRNEIVPPFRKTMILVTPRVLKRRIACLQNVIFNQKRWERSRVERPKFLSAPIPFRDFFVLFTRMN